MDARVIRQLRVKRRGQDIFLPHQHGTIVFARQHFDLWSELFEAGCAYENHFQEIPAERGSLVDDVAIELSAVGVAPDGDVEDTEPALRRIEDVARQQDGACAGPKRGFHLHEIEQLLETFFTEQVQERGGFATGDDERFDLVKLLRLLDEHNLGAEFFQAAAVGVEIALQRQHADFYASRGHDPF